jgi:protein phosphatase
VARVACSAASDRGVVRPDNQDSYLATLPVFAVADGMGGHADGQVASRVMIEELSSLAGTAIHLRDDVGAAIARANSRILAHADAHGSPNAGTTVAGIALVGDGDVEHWIVFNVGDSRVYRWSGMDLEQITVDHSESQELVAGGWLSEEEARASGRRNVVTRALGSDPAPEADWWLLPVMRGDRFVICSDGLVVEVEDDTIAEAVASAPLEDLAHKLVRNAVEAGGRDNVTVVAVEVLSGTADSLDEDTTPRHVVGGASG